MPPEALLPFLMQNSLSVGDFNFTGVSILLCTHYRRNNLLYYENYTEYAEKALDTQFTSYKPLPLPAFIITIIIIIMLLHFLVIRFIPDFPF